MSTALLAWVWAPVVLYAAFLGLGLLADGITRAELPPALLPPLGLAVAVLLATVGFRVHPPVVLPLLVLAAVAGFVVARAHLRERARAPVALLSAGLVYGLYMVPIVLTGEATWAGYNFVNDTAANFILTDALAQRGVAAPTDVSAISKLTSAFLGVGYPLGSFATLAGLRPLTGVPIESVYQPVLSLFAALGAMSLTELARRSGLRPAASVVAGTLPMGGVLLYRYVLHGSIKEIALAAMCLTAVSIAVIAVERKLPVRLVMLLAAVAAAMVLVFSFAAAAFAGALALGMLVAAFLAPDRPSLRHVAELVGIAVGLGVLALIPVLGSALNFADTIRSVFASSGGDPTAQFGQLVRPLPIPEAAGVWISRDYRFPADGPFNRPAVAAAVLVFLAGVAYCLWRRRIGPLLLLFTLGLPALALSPVSSVYIDGKLLVLLTPGVVFVAVFGALSGVQARRWPIRTVGWVALAAVGAGVLVSDLYTYRETRTAPLDKVAAMKDAAAKAPDRGLYLFNEAEEFGKFFMQDVRLNPATESQAPDPVRLRRSQPIFGQWFDLDRQKLSYVQNFAGVIARRSPAASRPPSNFRRVYANDYYEVWRRDGRISVAKHLPLQSRDRAVAVPRCADVKALARAAGPGQRLMAAARPRVARIDPATARYPAYWPPAGDVKGSLTTSGPGRVSGAVTTAGGRQRVWVRASAIRPLKVSVDGRPVGQADQLNTAGQWIDVGTVSLRPGSHQIRVERGSAGPRPGDSFYGYLGPVALEAVGRPRLVSVTPADATRLCGKPWDWIEVVTGRR